jgi:Phytochelatin synthase
MYGNGVIELPSPDGQQLLTEVRSKNSSSCYQPKLHRIFSKQKGSSSCGLVSCCHVLSASRLPLDDTPVAPVFTEDNMFSFTETNKAINQKKLIRDGTFRRLIHVHST